MMNNLYRDYLEGQFVPQIDISRRADNGHYVAKSMGLEVTDVNQADAVSKLSAQIEQGILAGDLHPYMD